MKKVTINVDLRENEAFEKEVEEIIRAKAREAVRDTHQEMLKKEIENEVRRLIGGGSGFLREKVEAVVRDIVRDEAKRKLKELDIEGLTEEITKKQIELISYETTSDIRRKCQSELEKVVTDSVKEKLVLMLRD